MTTALLDEKETSKARKRKASAKREEAAARKAVADAEIAEIDAKMRQIRLADLERDEASVLAADINNLTYRFESAVTYTTASTAISVLRKWKRAHPGKPITFIINSPGGSVIDGMALFDELVSMSIRGGGDHHITTVVRGYAASMGGILLQAGDTRVAGPESYLLIHEISAGTGGKIGDLEDAVTFYRKICQRVQNLFLARADGKITAASFKKGWSRKDWWLDSQEALDYGFIDKIG